MMLKNVVLAVAALITLGGAGKAPAPALQLGKLDRVATVDARYQGFNIEMVEVTGGRFWAPYGGPEGERYRQRPPINLADPRLIALARGLGPSLLRVSGTWANNTYLEAEGEHLGAPPAGFAQTLTRAQWKGVVAFSKAVDAPIVTSFAVSNGTRDANGVWTTAQAQRLIDLTREAGGSIYAAEFFNEANMPGVAPGMPEAYTAEKYGAEFRIFHNWARQSVPEMKIIGPGVIGEGSMQSDPPAIFRGMKFLSSDAMLRDNPGTLDGISYHFYGTASQRCGGQASLEVAKVEALSAGWLDRTLLDAEFYADLRDRHAPGKPLWNSETAQAACGGSPWASTFLDSFRYLNQLGVLAQRGVQVVLHNTLAASDYALIDPDTLTPRPNYWAAVLWRQNMDRTVLASPVSPSPDLRIYAHCLRGTKGGVALLALNTGVAAQDIRFGGIARVWTMTGVPLETRSIKVNGRSPVVTSDGRISGLDPVPARSRLTVPAQSLTFAAVPDAGNPACR